MTPSHPGAKRLDKMAGWIWSKQKKRVTAEVAAGIHTCIEGRPGSGEAYTWRVAPCSVRRRTFHSGIAWGSAPRQGPWGDLWGMKEQKRTNATHIRRGLFEMNIRPWGRASFDASDKNGGVGTSRISAIGTMSPQKKIRQRCVVGSSNNRLAKKVPHRTTRDVPGTRARGLGMRRMGEGAGSG